MNESMPNNFQDLVVCDHVEQFLKHFNGKAFSNLESFNNELLDFQKETGTQFILKRSCFFNEGTLAREYLVYRQMTYACVRHIRPSSKLGQKIGSTGCQAFFTVGTRKHKLFVRQYDMRHNHPAYMPPVHDLQFSSSTRYSRHRDFTSPSSTHLLDPTALFPFPLNANNDSSSMGETVQDFTPEFQRIFGSSNMSFDTFDEFQTKMDEFESLTGNRYVKTNTRRLPATSPLAEKLVYSHLVYICFRYGSKESEAKQRRLQRTLKIGCGSKINIYAHNGKLVVRKYDLRHNHEVRPDLVHYLPKRRQRNRKDKEAEESSTTSLVTSSSSSHITSQSVDAQFRGDSHGDVILSESGFSGKIEDEDSLLESGELSRFSLHRNAFEDEEDLRCYMSMDELDIPHEPLEYGDEGLPPLDGILPICDSSLEVDLSKASSRETHEAMISHQLQRLSELSSNCGSLRLASRLKELKALGDKWLRENEALISPKRC